MRVCVKCQSVLLMFTTHMKCSQFKHDWQFPSPKVCSRKIFANVSRKKKWACSTKPLGKPRHTVVKMHYACCLTVLKMRSLEGKNEKYQIGTIYTLPTQVSVPSLPDTVTRSCGVPTRSGVRAAKTDSKYLLRILLILT